MLVTKNVLFLHVLMHTHPHPRSPFLSLIDEQVENQLCRVIPGPSDPPILHGGLAGDIGNINTAFLAYIVQSILQIFCFESYKLLAF